MKMAKILSRKKNDTQFRGEMMFVIFLIIVALCALSKNAQICVSVCTLVHAPMWLHCVNINTKFTPCTDNNIFHQKFLLP